MTEFSRAVVRLPGDSLSKGLSSTPGGQSPDPGKARQQHGAYVNALETLGLEVDILPAEESFPDAVFVEDTAVFMGPGVMITRPGAPSRLGEAAKIAPHIAGLGIEMITMRPPGTLDGGDVLLVDNVFFVGMSARTNREGLRQFTAAAQRFGFATRPVPLAAGLHLKSGLSLVGEKLLLAAPGCGEDSAFCELNLVYTPPEEAYAANCVLVNGTVLAASGYPRTREILTARGCRVMTLDVGEFRKVDGGLSCLSLRF